MHFEKKISEWTVFVIDKRKSPNSKKLKTKEEITLWESNTPECFYEPECIKKTHALFSFWWLLPLKQQLFTYINENKKKPQYEQATQIHKSHNSQYFAKTGKC